MIIMNNIIQNINRSVSYALKILRLIFNAMKRYKVALYALLIICVISLFSLEKLAPTLTIDLDNSKIVEFKGEHGTAYIAPFEQKLSFPWAAAQGFPHKSIHKNFYFSENGKLYKQYSNWFFEIETKSYGDVKNLPMFGFFDTNIFYKMSELNLGKAVYFSVSDQSDPRTSQKQYQVSIGSHINSYLLYILIGTMVLLSLCLLIMDDFKVVKGFWRIFPGTLLFLLILLSMNNFYGINFIIEIFKVNGYIKYEGEVDGALLIITFIAAAMFLAYLVRLKIYWSAIIILAYMILSATSIILHNLFGDISNIIRLNVLLDAEGAAENAFAEYKNDIIHGVVSSLIIIIPLILLSVAQTIWMKRNLPHNIFGKILARFIRQNQTLRDQLFIFVKLSLLLVVISVSYLLIIFRQQTDVYSYRGGPIGFTVAFNIVTIKLDQLIKHFTLTSFTPSNSFEGLKFDKVIFLVDESVEYEEFAKLWYNSSPNLPSTNWIDFGMMKSAANCSAASHFVLRGNALWDNDAIVSSYWQSNSYYYQFQRTEPLLVTAKKHGYRVSYIDAPSVLVMSGSRNFMTKDEDKSIDFYHKPTGLYSGYNTDKDLVRAINSELGQKKLFVYGQKLSTHFPYTKQLPPEIVTDDKMTNYRIAVKINTVDLLHDLTESMDDKTILFYTSDHGQNFKARMTHCNLPPDSVSSEYHVPALIFTKNKQANDYLHRVQPLLKNRLTHLEWTESARNILGAEIKNNPSLFKNLPLKTSYCGLFGMPVSLFDLNSTCSEVPNVN